MVRRPGCDRALNSRSRQQALPSGVWSLFDRFPEFAAAEEVARERRRHDAASTALWNGGAIKPPNLDEEDRAPGELEEGGSW